MAKISFEDWFLQNEERLSIMAAEEGFDREYDYNHEDFAESMYDTEVGFD